jgi:hypothetical protein
MSTNQDLFAGLDVVVNDTRKKFDDAIFRCRTGETKTAEQLWGELAVEQESKGDGMVSALKCVGILNQLTRRKQISVF